MAKPQANAKAELEAEAGAGKARQREEQAEAAELEAAEAEASGEEQRSRLAERRSRGARKQADNTRQLAIETALAAGLESPALTADRDPLAMPSRQLPTDAAGNPKPDAHRHFKVGPCPLKVGTHARALAASPVLRRCCGKATLIWTGP